MTKQITSGGSPIPPPEFPQTVNYGSLSGLYPANGADAAYTDGEFSIAFDGQPELLPGGTLWLYDVESGAAVDVVAFENERQNVPGAAGKSLFVGGQLARVEGNAVFFTPHFEKLGYNRRYYIAIPRNSIRAALNGRPFDGLPDSKRNAAWTFSTRTAPILDSARPVTVDGSPNSTADFRTVYGALRALAAKSGEWQVHVAPGIYRELVHYHGTADIDIAGQGTAPFGQDVVIQYANCEQMNGGTKARPVFYFSGANLTLKNVAVKNTAVRGVSYTGGAVSGDTQAEAFNFDGDGGKTFVALNCSFISRQDTVQTSGKNWLYQCYIEGDVDFIWGTADACLIEDCAIAIVNDSARAAKESYLLVSRTGSVQAETVPKGYVVLNCRIKVADGMKFFLGRNAGGRASGYYDQCAVIDTAIALEGNAQLENSIWKNSPYVCIPGAAEHVGWKLHGVTVNGLPLNTGAMLANTALIPRSLYESEYRSPYAILNRAYRKDGTYIAVSDWKPRH